jgi:hypothetical protein
VAKRELWIKTIPHLQHTNLQVLWVDFLLMAMEEWRWR